METRTIEQVKIYKLILNPIRANYEATNIAAVSYDKQHLIDWYESLKVKPYVDEGRWSKSFKKGSPLEWYNTIEYGDHCTLEEEWTTQDDINNYIEYAQNSMGFVAVPEFI